MLRPRVRTAKTATETTPGAKFSPLAASTFATVQEFAPSEEIGGQLFGTRSSGNNLEVFHVTFAHVTAKRSRFLFLPSRHAEQIEINLMATRGLEYLGDWHTHPEPRPFPSSTDLSSILAISEKSKPRPPSILLVVVGTSPLPDGIYVGVTYGAKVQKLNVVLDETSQADQVSGTARLGIFPQEPGIANDAD